MAAKFAKVRTTHQLPSCFFFVMKRSKFNNQDINCLLGFIKKKKKKSAFFRIKPNWLNACVKKGTGACDYILFIYSATLC